MKKYPENRDPVKRREWRMKWRAENREKRNAGERARYWSGRTPHIFVPPSLAEVAARKHRKAQKHREWSAARPGHVAALHKAWVAKNRGKTRERTRRRDAAKLRATPAWADVNRIRIVYEAAAAMQAELGIRLEVDHVVPLQGRNVRGLHVHENMQILPKADNISKHNRWVP